MFKTKIEVGYADDFQMRVNLAGPKCHTLQRYIRNVHFFDQVAIRFCTLISYVYLLN